METFWGERMKLDPRIENESLIYTPFSNTVDILHEKGYFANDLQAFSDLEQCKYGKLVSCNFDGNYPYIWGSCTICYSTSGFAFFIPESSLKPVEEKENKTDKPLALDEVIHMCEKCMKEISELKDELQSIKYQLKSELAENKSANCNYIPPYGFNPQNSCCVAIKNPGEFNTQSNWCRNTFEYK